MSPPITVLMTVYNGMPYLRQAVESILGQTFTDFRFVIVDDGSQDATADYLSQLDDPRIQIISQENGGTAAAANHGLEHVHTKYVARMDADDVAMPERLEKQLAFMEANEDVGLAGTQVAPIGEFGAGGSLHLPDSHEKIFSALMEGRHGLAHSSIIMRTDLLKSVGGYWKLKLIDDWDMMLRMGEQARLANLREVLLSYRVHSGSLNGQSMMRMHRHISFAIDRAKRRQTGQPEISFEEFQSQKQQRPLPTRVLEAIHVYALTQYRIALAEIYGGKKWLGQARLVWSAVCSPSRTFGRIKRAFDAKSRNGRNQTSLTKAV